MINGIYFSTKDLQIRFYIGLIKVDVSKFDLEVPPLELTLSKNLRYQSCAFHIGFFRFIKYLTIYDSIYLFTSELYKLDKGVEMVTI